jgi:hypothetical protein
VRVDALRRRPLMRAPTRTHTRRRSCRQPNHCCSKALLLPLLLLLLLPRHPQLLPHTLARAPAP